MGTSRSDIERWFKEGIKDKKSFMIIWCDTFDYEDYPKYYDTSEQVNAAAKHNGQNMQKIMVL